MKATGKRCRQDFKRMIVDLYNTTDYTYASFESVYSISHGTIQSWAKQFTPIDRTSKETMTPAEYKQLRKKMAKICEIIKTEGTPETIPSMIRIKLLMTKLSVRAVVFKFFKPYNTKAIDADLTNPLGVISSFISYTKMGHSYHKFPYSEERRVLLSFNP